MPAPSPAPPPPRVSVALCTCNGQRFLREQLDSIQNQSRPVDEIIISDDCSDDTTAEIVLAFAADTSVTVKWFRNPIRLGVTKNFERAISLCTGDILFLCDQDDRWHPEKVKVLIHALDQPPVALAFSNAQVVDENLHPLGYRLWDSIWFDAREQQQMKTGQPLPALLRHAIAAGSTLAFKSEYLPLLLPIPDLPHSHDIWITLLLACVGQLEPVDRDLIQYRLHASNQVGMKKYTLLDQLRMAKHQIRNNTFSYLRDLHQLALDRLNSQSNWAVQPQVILLLQEKIDHSDIRHRLPRNWFARLPAVAKELRRRNYRKYSYGCKSVLQDLFLR
jgi:glycosyltransferase involved in cell wall biosynthesis